MEPLRVGDPRQIGPYRLEGRLGEGGMGQVFLGRSPGARAVAVKVVRAELAGDARFRERFASEVTAARRVGGFYTAQVVQADVNAEPPWLATAYIPGPSLQEAVDEHGPLPPETVKVLGAGLAEGLAAIHACDLVHRDLKPGNVILAADGPRVIDFGIARALDASQHTASIMGTPAFMSPEQGRGDAVGPPSDVFSLGAVLTFAATGHGPFGGGPAHAVIYRIIHDQPYLPDLPARLVDLIAACLSKEPAGRPSLAAVLDQLNAVPQATRWLPPDITTMITKMEVPAPEGPPTEPPGRTGSLLASPAGITTGVAALAALTAVIATVLNARSPASNSADRHGSHSPPPSPARFSSPPPSPTIGTIFRDDFSGSTRWTVGGQTDQWGRDHGQSEYTDGELRLLPRAGFALWVPAPVSANALSDVRISATGHIAGGAGGLGVWCRGGPDPSYPRYSFYVSTMKTVSIVKEGTSDGRNLVGDLPAPMVRPYSDNLITAECLETGRAIELRLTVNGELAATAREDTNISTGTHAGVDAVTWTSPSPKLVDARFSDFQIEQLPTTPFRAEAGVRPNRRRH